MVVYPLCDQHAGVYFAVASAPVDVLQSDGEKPNGLAQDDKERTNPDPQQRAALALKNDGRMGENQKKNINYGEQSVPESEEEISDSHIPHTHGCLRQEPPPEMDVLFDGEKSAKVVPLKKDFDFGKSTAL